MTLPLATDVKVTKGGKYNKDTKKVEDADTVTEGTKTEVLTKIGEKGVRARITTSIRNLVALRDLLVRLLPADKPAVEMPARGGTTSKLH